MKHNHNCYCGTASPNGKTPHHIGTMGCVRRMADAPIRVPMADAEVPETDRWQVDGVEITGFTLRQQRGYHQHPCGCWSSSNDSVNSIKG